MLFLRLFMLGFGVAIGTTAIWMLRFTYVNHLYWGNYFPETMFMVLAIVVMYLFVWKLPI